MHLRFTALALAALLAPAAWAAAPFTPNGDGTVTDALTDLAWDQCTWGQSGDDCADGSAAPGTWAQALAAVQQANADAYKGHTDWRLPNVKELESLVDLGQTDPSIDVEAFPNVLNNHYVRFWSSTPARGDRPEEAWIVEFRYGSIYATPNSDSSYLRLVRGGEPPAAFELPDAATPPVAPTPTAVPTLGEWALALLGLLLAALGLRRLGRR